MMTEMSKYSVSISSSSNCFETTEGEYDRLNCTCTLVYMPRKLMNEQVMLTKDRERKILKNSKTITDIDPSQSHSTVASDIEGFVSRRRAVSFKPCW